MWPSLYSTFYWSTAFVTAILGYAVILEIYNRSLARFPGVAPFIRAVLVGLLFLVAARAFAELFGGAANPLASSAALLERDLRTLQAILLGVFLGIVSFYHIPIGKNLRGIIVGYTLYVGVRVVKLTAYTQSGKTVGIFVSKMEPVIYLICLGLWTLALWSQAPELNCRYGAQHRAKLRSSFASNQNATLARIRLSNKDSSPVIPALFSIVVGVLLLGILAYWLFSERSFATDARPSTAETSKAFGWNCRRRISSKGCSIRATSLSSARNRRPKPSRLFEQERQGVGDLLAAAYPPASGAADELSRGCGTSENINLRPALEIKLGLHYVRFLVLCELESWGFLTLVRVPFQIRLMMGYVVGVTAQLCGVSDKLLGATQFSTPASAPPPTQ